MPSTADRLPTLPAGLPQISFQTHNAISDTIARALIAWDTFSPALLSSALTPDAEFHMLGGPSIVGVAELIKAGGLFDKVGRMDTTHIPSNVRIMLGGDAGEAEKIKRGEVREEDAREARVTATVVAQHYRPGEGAVPGAKQLMAGSLYYLELVKAAPEGGVEEVWKIKTWRMQVVWRMGDGAVMQ